MKHRLLEAVMEAATASAVSMEDEGNEEPGLRKTRLTTQREEERENEAEDEDPGIFEEVCVPPRRFPPPPPRPPHPHTPPPLPPPTLRLDSHAPCARHRRNGTCGRMRACHLCMTG